MKKGFVLITDMLLAVSIMAVLVTSSVYVMRNHPDWKRVKETQVGGDLLRIMHSKKVLQTLSEEECSSFLEEHVPTQFKVKLIVSAYNATNPNNIFLNNTFIINHPVNATEPTDFGIVKRTFTIREGGVTTKLGVAEVRVWV